MTDRLQLAALWDDASCAGERCPCPRCVATLDDPSAATVFAALDATRRDLAALWSPAAGAMPDDVRVAVLAAADALRSPGPRPAGATSRVLHRAAGRRRPRGTRRPGRRSRVALVAALGVAVLAGTVGRPAGPDSPPEPTRHALVGTPEPGRGPLAGPDRQAACLAAVGIPPAAALATRDVTVDGTAGVLLVLPTGTIGTYRMLVVDTGCTRVLADRTVGR